MTAAPDKRGIGVSVGVGVSVGKTVTVSVGVRRWAWAGDPVPTKVTHTNSKQKPRMMCVISHKLRGHLAFERSARWGFAHTPRQITGEGYARLVRLVRLVMNSSEISAAATTTGA